MLNKTVEEQNLINQLQRRWLAGNSEALKSCHVPDEWWPLLKNEKAERQNILALALCSQFQAFYESGSVENTNVNVMPELPVLELPTLPAGSRFLFRRAIEISKKHNIHIRYILHLLTQRKVSAHPADWLPSPQDDDLPSMYWPWCRWIANELPKSENIQENLNEATWDTFYPAERLVLLRQLRLSDSASARELISVCAGNESAEKRLKIIDIIEINLSLDDVEYLQTLSKDRSQKIKLKALQFLARLGISQHTLESESTPSLAQELAETFQLKTVGVFKKRLTLSPLLLKSKKQQAVRTEQLGHVHFAEFAKALNIDDKKMASAWLFVENREQDNHNFLLSAINTASDEIIDLLLINALDNIQSQTDHYDSALMNIHILLPRLSLPKRVELIEELLQHKNIKLRFANCLLFLEAPFQNLHWDSFSRFYAWRQLSDAVRNDLKQQAYVNDYQAALDIHVLGLILPQKLAEQALESLVKLGVLRADPVLNNLKLNIQLTQG